MHDFVASPQIEFLIVANHAEAVNGLLYLSGGGWTDHRRPVRPGQAAIASHFGIGVSVRVPWSETNRQHRLRVTIENQDATAVLTTFDADFTVGRPPALPPGEDQHSVLALAAEVLFPRPGGYRVVARLNGDGDMQTWPFRVHDIPVYTG